MTCATLVAVGGVLLSPEPGHRLSRSAGFRISRAARIEVTAVTVTADTTREELVEALSHLTTEAKALSRMGKRGTLTPRYADLHRNIDVMVTELERMPTSDRTD